MAKANPKRPPDINADRPVVTIIGLGQMGLVCSAILAAPEMRGEAGPAATPGNGGNTPAGSVLPRPVRVRMWGRLSDETGPLAQTRKSPRLPGFVLPDGVEVCLREEQEIGRAHV